MAVPTDADEFGDAWLEQRIAVDGNCLPFLGADNIGIHPLAGDTSGIRESVLIEQRYEPMERIAFALVRRGRQ